MGIASSEFYTVTSFQCYRVLQRRILWTWGQSMLGKECLCVYWYMNIPKRKWKSYTLHFTRYKVKVTERVIILFHTIHASVQRTIRGNVCVSVMRCRQHNHSTPKIFNDNSYVMYTHIFVATNKYCVESGKCEKLWYFRTFVVGCFRWQWWIEQEMRAIEHVVRQEESERDRQTERGRERERMRGSAKRSKLVSNFKMVASRLSCVSFFPLISCPSPLCRMLWTEFGMKISFNCEPWNNDECEDALAMSNDEPCVLMPSPSLGKQYSHSNWFDCTEKHLKTLVETFATCRDA